MVVNVREIGHSNVSPNVGTEIAMADNDGTARKVWVLPTELSDRIRSFQMDQGIASEVEAARRLLDLALQMRDNVGDILAKMKSRFIEEKDLRVLARDVLTGHALVTQIMLNDSDVTFRMRDGTFGMIDKSGRIFTGDEAEYLREVVEPRPRSPVGARGGAPSWEAPKGGDLDDEIPF